MKKVYEGCGIHQKSTPYSLARSGIVTKIYETEWHKMATVMWQDSKVEDWPVIVLEGNRFVVINRELTEEDRWYA